MRQETEKSSLVLPKGWPSTIRFTSEYITSSSISSPTCQFLKIKTQEGPYPCIHESVSKGPVSKVRIKQISDPHHPAKGELGLFATQTLEPRSLILNYIGQVVKSSQESKTSNYTMNFFKGMSGLDDLVIDAEKMGNEARHINDYRGIAKRPNAEFKNYRDSEGRLRVGVWVLHEKIRKNSEILVSYGKGFWAARMDSILG